MISSYVGWRGKNVCPSKNRHSTRVRSILLSPIISALFLIIVSSHSHNIEAYTSVSVIHRPSDFFFHLAAFSSLSVTALSSNRNFGTYVGIPSLRARGGGSSSSSTGTPNQNLFAESSLLATKCKQEAEDCRNVNSKNQTSEAPSHSISTPALPSISDTPTASPTKELSIDEIHNPNGNKTMRQWKESIEASPRARACILMATAMSLHFGGYEFARSAALALFTSSETGFTHPSAYPFAIGLVTPLTLFLLYWYGTLLKSSGPRNALRQTTFFVLGVLLVGDGLVSILTSTAFVWNPCNVAWLTRLIVGPLFVFQNSYAHLIYTQQWSFLGSVMTPTEGTQWFTFIAGLSSLVCTLTASSVQTIASRSGGLVLLICMTCATLGLSMLCADRAYELSAEHGFDPSGELQAKQSKKDSQKETGAARNEDESLLAKTGRMFRTSPTLAGLFGEVIAFQSLSTVLNVCFVRQLKLSIPVDGERAAFTGKFYAGVNGISGLMQFFVLPLLRNYLEPQWVYRFLPLALMPLLTYSAILPTSATNGLSIAAAAFFALKAADYSIRNVANELVYQPLDFDARYLGKEVIGVFANRFGKSGTSMILSGLSGLGLMTKGTRPMSQLAVAVGGLWSACSIYLSGYVVTNRQAEEQVQQRSSSSSSRTASQGSADKPAVETFEPRLMDGENSSSSSAEATPAIITESHADEAENSTTAKLKDE